MYSPDGERLTILSREGDGPGETRIPANLLFMPDGHFLKTVSAKCEGDGENDILIWTPEGNAVVVTRTRTRTERPSPWRSFT